jgi:hypothetical protein
MAGAGFFPKVALTTSRIVYYPFTIPAKLDGSATAIGAAGTQAVGAANAAIGNAYMSLKPRGPAKWLVPMFTHIDAGVKHSADIATRNKNVFWDPFSNGSQQIGQAVAGPGAYWYLKKAGDSTPSDPTHIRAILEMGLFKYPQAATNAAEGAGNAAPPDTGGAPPPDAGGAPPPDAGAPPPDQGGAPAGGAAPPPDQGAPPAAA